MPPPASRTVIQTLADGSIKIPRAIQARLGIDEASLLEITTDGDRIVITKLNATPTHPPRVYSDDEIAAFIAEDRLSPETAAWLDDRLGPWQS